MTSTMLDAACFACKEQNSASFLGSTYFQKLIDSELPSEESREVRFFDKNYPVSTCMGLNLKELFSEVKKHFFIIKGLSVDNISSLKNDFMYISVENLRMDILRVLKLFLVKVQEMNLKQLSSKSVNVEETSVHKCFNVMLMSLLTEIKNLLLFVGHISNIPGVSNIRDFSSDHSKTASKFYHFYHLCLDIWFICLATVYKISLMLPKHLDFDVFCDSFNQFSIFFQLAAHLIYEFTCLTLNRYKNINVYKHLPFPCQCIQDFWIILIHLIERCESVEKVDSFWSIYQSVLQLILKNSSSNFNNEPTIRTLAVCNMQLPKEDLIEASFWITSHLAPLFKHNNMGKISSYMQPKSGYIVIKYLIQNLLTNASVAEKHLRSILSYSVPLVNIWEVSGEILLPFTDFFIRKIEETFCIQSTEVTSLSYLFKDSLTWLTYISNISSENLTCRGSSFDHFLHILHIQVKQDTDKSLWRVLKGRIYSKYFPKKIKELSEIGLQNTLSLFLTVASSNQFEISGKICEVLSVVESTAHHRKQLITWKAVFVLMYIYQERNQNMQDIIKLISNFFDTASMDYSRISTDSMHKNNIMNLLLVYIDNMNEIFKRNGGMDLSLDQLITKGFASLLPTCSVSEMNYNLQVFNEVLQNISKNVVESDCFSDKVHYTKIVEAIFNHVYPFIQNIATSDTPPVVVSDIAISLTKIVAIFSSGFSCLPYDSYKIFMYFGCKENVNCIITGHYLSSVLDCPDVMNEIRLKVEDLGRIIWQAWLKCSVYMHQKSEYMDVFTKKLLNSDLKIIPDLASFDHDISDHVKASIHFYELIGETYYNSNSPKRVQMAQTVQQVFKNYAFYATNKMKKAKDSDCFTHVYKLISHLILKCSTVLHQHVTSDHVLLELLDKTIYPQIIFPKDKVLQSLVTNSVKEHLPEILKGLFKLEYRKDKPVEREIRDIMICYISAFPPNNNPLVKLMLDSVAQKPDGLSLDAYQFILETLKSSFLSNNTEKPTCILEFFHEIFRLTSVDCKKEISDVLLKCCLEVFMKRNDAFSETLKIVLKKTLLYFKEKMQYSHTKAILVPVVQWFVMEKLQWSVMRGFSVLDIFVDYLPQLISDMMSILTTSVESLERSRGMGEDMLLRNGLRNIVFKLQQKLCK